MKKNVIALAVAAAMAAPLAAQAEVTVSGQLQAELLSLSGDTVTEGLYVADAQEMGVVDSGNFGAINFSASEDLGNGMKAIAKVGMNVWASKGQKTGVITRDSYVGLSGNFGTVMAGSMSSPYKMTTVKWDPFLASSAQARGNYGMSSLHNGYADNAIAYANKFGMVKVVAAIVVDETAGEKFDLAAPGFYVPTGETVGNHGISLGINVPVGPVEIAFAYQDLSGYGEQDNSALLALVPGLVIENNDDTAMKVGVKYSAGALGVAFQYETLSEGNGLVLAGTPDTTDTDHMYLNATYTAGANTFAAAYGQSEVDGSDTTQTYMSLGMVHGFSKSTSAHIAYVALDHDGADDSGVAAGLRVKF